MGVYPRRLCAQGKHALEGVDTKASSQCAHSELPAALLVGDGLDLIHGSGPPPLHNLAKPDGSCGSVSHRRNAPDPEYRHRASRSASGPGQDGGGMMTWLTMIAVIVRATASEAALAPRFPCSSSYAGEDR